MDYLLDTYSLSSFNVFIDPVCLLYMITQLVSVKLKHFLSFTRVYISGSVIDDGLISKVCLCL
jgi:hypothetical protein